MRILLTGSSGSIGSKVLKSLEKYKCHILAHYHSNCPKLKNKKISYVNTKNLIKKDFKIIQEFKPEIVIHLAAIGLISSGKTKLNIMNCNFNFTKSLINNLINSSVKNFYFASTAKIYQYSSSKINEKSKIKPLSKLNTYEKSKLMIEKYVQKNQNNFSFNFVSLRIFPTIDKDDIKKNIFARIQKNIKKNIKFKIYNPNLVIDFNTSSFISKCIIKIILKKPKKKYNIINIGSGSNNYKFSDFINNLFKIQNYISTNDKSITLYHSPDLKIMSKYCKIKKPSIKNIFDEIDIYLGNIIK